MGHCPACFRRLPPGARCPADGTRAPVRAADPGAPPEVPEHRVGACLGAGGNATVWAARDGTGRAVAIKVARVATEHARSRMELEAAALAAVRPPHAPALHGAGTLADGRPFLVVEALPGTSLASELERAAGPLALDRALAVADRLLAALEAAHRAGVVHRDLAPDNIFLVGDRVVLLDFGISWQTQDERTTRTGWVLGTPLYMAPEQLRGEPVDARTDLYAFGAILFECLTLRPPFVGDDGAIERGHQLERPPRPSELAPVPVELEALILACLAKNPADRPDSATALRRWLTGVSRERTLPTPPRPPTSRLEHERQPVVLLVVDGAPLSSDAAACVRAHRGTVVRQRRHGFTCAFSALQDHDPAEAALAAAEALLASRGGRAAVHLVELKARSGDDGALRVYGASVERPESWLPGGAWDGIVLTNQMAEVMPADRLRPAPSAAGFFALDADAAARAHAPFVGRGAEVARIEAALAAAATAPALVTIVGERGLGRTRLGDLTAELAAARFGATRSLMIRCSRGAIDRALTALGRALEVDAAGWELGDALRRAGSEAPLAVVVDDLHLGSDGLLDALEYASLDWPGSGLLIAITAEPSLFARRPDWGQRAHRHDRLGLEPLSRSATIELARELLWPAEYVPSEALEQLAERAAGNPFLLSELVRRLARDGAIARRPGAEGWSLDPRRLEALPPSATGQWLAARELDGMDGDLAALARICSILGGELTVDELGGVQLAAERAGTATSGIDAGEGLRELGRLGLLEGRDGSWSFARPLIQESIYASLRQRDRRALHRYAFVYWTDRAEPDEARRLHALARHGAACGELGAAAAARLALGDRARARHRYVEAELHYGAASELATDSLTVARALLGRGAMRYRVQRIRAAIEDLRAAAEAARGRDDRLCAEALLEQSTALDWAEEFADSARLADLARPLVDEIGDERLAVRLLNADGRTRWRKEDPAGAAELLGACADRAARIGDDETRAAALLLLGCALVFAGRTVEARRRFDEAIACCERTGDQLHLCGAYANRMFAWRSDPSRAVADLRRAVDLARAIGHPTLERVASHNLAELLYWSGDDDGALTLARRGRVLQQRFVAAPVADDALLLARICAARGDARETRQNVAWVREHVPEDSLAPSDRLFLDLLDLVSDANPSEPERRWRELAERAGTVLAGEERLEVLYFGTRLAPPEAVSVHHGAVDELLRKHPIWRTRFDRAALRRG